MKVTLAGAFAVGEWQHVAATCTKNTLGGYFDGGSKGSSADPQPPRKFDSILLGRGNSDLVATRFKGWLDGVRIYGWALPQSELKDVFDAKR